MSVENLAKYLDEADAKRFRELEDKGTLRLTFLEGLEHAALMFKIVDKKEALGEFDIPFEGKCRRCGQEFDNPVPEVTHSEGSHEIACEEWCPDCNILAMSVIFRGFSAYRKEKGQLVDPLKGGRYAST